MDPRIAALLEKAIHRAPAVEANEAIAKMRQELGDDFSEAISYEILLPEEKAVEHLTGSVLPRMVYFLECRGAKLPHCPGVFASLFAGAELYFLHAADVIAALSELSGLSIEEMVKRHGAASV